MTAVVETSMQQPPIPVSSWARRITDWETRNAGKLWQCRLIGEHHGAEVVQYVQAHWFGHWVWHYSTLFVTRRGPACPAWCRTHTYTRPELPDLTPTVSHERVILSGSMWVTLSQIQTLPHGIVFEPSIHCSSQAMADLTVEDARNLVRAIEYALDRIEEGVQA